MGRQAAFERKGQMMKFVFHSIQAAMIAMITAAALAGAAYAKQPGSPVNTIGSNGVAIRGYDPVAYFTQGKPVKGDASFTLDHGGARWHFSSDANRQLFQADPAKYAPAYGGYCAYGVASGYLVKIEPEAWTIRDGKLYLNYDVSVQKEWAKDPAGFIKKADVNWPGLAGKQAGGK